MVHYCSLEKNNTAAKKTTLLANMLISLHFFPSKNRNCSFILSVESIFSCRNENFFRCKNFEKLEKTASKYAKFEKTSKTQQCCFKKTTRLSANVVYPKPN